MNIRAIKTKKISVGEISLEKFLDDYIVDVKENSIIVVTSKVISLIENRVAPLTTDLDKLIHEEADYISKDKNRYDRYTTFKFNALVSGAGIDQSNGDGSYILLPKDPQKTAKYIYDYLTKKFKIFDFGVIITDSRSMPLRVGASGVAIGFWGFAPLKDYVGTEDIFGRKLQFEKANVVDALATAAVLVMGEGNEQTPLAVIEDLNFIDFKKDSPTQTELKEFYISIDDDIFHQFYDNFR